MPVTITNLCKSFGTKKVLNNLNLTLEDGGIYCLMGPSGMGKTTLLRIMLGLEKADSGEITGIDPGTEISSMFQEDRLLPMLSAIDNVNLMYDKKRPVRELKADLSQILPARSLRQPVSELSGGMKRRVALARCMHFPGKMIIMDEPFTGLDMATRQEVIAYILKNRRGRILLVATHGEGDAAMLGAKIIRLEECQDMTQEMEEAMPENLEIEKNGRPGAGRGQSGVPEFSPMDMMKALMAAGVNPVDMMQAMAAAGTTPGAMFSAIAEAGINPADMMKMLSSAGVNPLDLMRTLAEAGINPAQMIQAMTQAGINPADMMKTMSSMGMNPLDLIKTMIADGINPIDMFRGMNEHDSQNRAGGADPSLRNAPEAAGTQSAPTPADTQPRQAGSTFSAGGRTMQPAGAALSDANVPESAGVESGLPASASPARNPSGTEKAAGPNPQPQAAAGSVSPGHLTDLLGNSSLKLLEGIPKEQWERTQVLLGARVRTFERGQIIWRIGDVLTDFTVVLDGMIAAYTENLKSIDSLVAKFSAGHCFGEMLPISGMPSPVKVMAAEKSRILFIPAKKLMAEPKSIEEARIKSRIAWNMVYEIADKLTRVAVKLDTTSESTVHDKIIKYLNSLPTDADGAKTMFQVQRETAMYLRVSQEALSKEFSDMERKGIIRKENNRIFILKPEIFEI